MNVILQKQEIIGLLAEKMLERKYLQKSNENVQKTNIQGAEEIIDKVLFCKFLYYIICVLYSIFYILYVIVSSN